MPLHNFIKISVTGDLYWLVKSGKPTQTQLEDAWSNIFMEYTELSPSTQNEYIANLTRDIQALQYKIHLIYQIIYKLEQEYNKQLCDILVEWGFMFAYTEESYYDDLEPTLIQANSLIVQLKVKKGELKVVEQQSEGKGVTEADYDSLLSTLSRFQHYHLNKHHLTVTEFVAIFNQFKEDNKHGKQSAD